MTSLNESCWVTIDLFFLRKTAAFSEMRTLWPPLPTKIQILDSTSESESFLATLSINLSHALIFLVENSMKNTSQTNLLFARHNVIRITHKLFAWFQLNVYLQLNVWVVYFMHFSGNTKFFNFKNKNLKVSV